MRHRPARPGAEPPFQRFPTWMWRNTDVAAFVKWLRGHNQAIADPERRAGFYGLDIYNMRGSIAAVLSYLEEVDPAAARVARERYGCLTLWQNEYATYGRAVLTEFYRKCEAEVIAQCRDLLRRELDYATEDEAGFLDAAQNARLIASAERYYRIMYYGGAESWNLRDTHMFETLEHLLKAGGPEAKAVVWAHNSHIGDARQTDMGQVRGELNIGQLCRERWGESAALIGFGTHTGTVAAASDWDGEIEVKRVRPLIATATNGSAMTRALGVSCSTSTTTGPRVEGFYKRGSSGLSAFSFGPKPSCPATTQRRACRSSSMPGSGSTRRPPSRRSVGRTGAKACRIPIRSVCRVGGPRRMWTRLPPAWPGSCFRPNWSAWRMLFKAASPRQAALHLGESRTPA